MTKAEFDKQMADLDRELSQVPAAPVKTVVTPPAAGPEWWSNQNAMTMSAVVLIFGIVVLVLCAGLMRSSRPSSEAILRVFGTVLIITGALFLVVAGYTDQQVAPVMGLLGTLAGYLLGKGSPNEPGPPRTDK
ncbi:hypothetical protein AZOA_30090 [Azoarcus sp. Aa7]|nr:hypothetical protein [Azoarcus sp. Aa7]